MQPFHAKSRYSYVLGDSQLILSHLTDITTPGVISGNDVSGHISPDEAIAKSVADGLTFLGTDFGTIERIYKNEINLGKDVYPIALYYGPPHIGYHWYRFDSDGTVSSKNFYSVPKKLGDSVGQPSKLTESIVDSLGVSANFKGCFTVPRTLSIPANKVISEWMAWQGMLQRNGRAYYKSRMSFETYTELELVQRRLSPYTRKIENYTGSSFVIPVS